MEKKWLQAAERYKAKSRPGFKPRRKRESKPPPKPESLAEFMDGPKGKAALALLAAADEEIILGDTPIEMGMTSSLVFTKKGFRATHSVGGLAAAYTGRQSKPRTEAVSTEEVLWFWRDCDHNREQNESDLLRQIENGLNRIADEAP